MEQPLVVISYPVDEELREANRDTLQDAAQVVFLQDQQPSQRLETLRQAEALIGWRLGRELAPGRLAEARRLRLIQFQSAGVDSVDFTAIPAGIVIADNGGAYARPMAEHVMAMTLSLAKRLPQRHAALARGHFDQQAPSLTLDGAVCAILGFGGIGKRTAALLRAFGARIHAVNTSGQTTEPVEFVGTLAELDRVLAAADVLVISLPLTRATRSIIGERELARMKASAILVNVARAGIIDQAALYEHLRATPTFSAGIDTWWHEPPLGEDFRTDYPFFDLPNVLGSPHNSAIVAGSQAFAARNAAANVRRYLQGKSLAGVVRREDYLSSHGHRGTAESPTTRSASSG
jgi:phosphoglycerate dehydrogenase-like enzyme